MGISITTRQAYTEIDNFIELLDEHKKNKIPQKLREYFKKEKDKEYIKTIDLNQPIKEQNLKEETLALIAMLNLQYWCEDENEKQRLKTIYSENERKYQNELREKNKPDNLFKIKKHTTLNSTVDVSQNSSTSLIEYKESFLIKFKNFIFKLLHINN